MRWLALILLTAPLAWAQSSLDPRAAAMLTELPPYGADIELRYLLAQELSDESGNAHDGTATGGVTLLNGVAKFDGTGYIDCGDIENSTIHLTVSTWICTTNKTALQTVCGRHTASGNKRSFNFFLIGSTGEFQINISSDGSLAAGLGTLNCRFDVCDGEWHQLVYTFEPYQSEMWIDGEQIDATRAYNPNPAYLYGTPAPFSIGANDADATPLNYYNGKIGRTIVFSRTLSADEIMQLYLEGPY